MKITKKIFLAIICSVIGLVAVNGQTKTIITHLNIDEKKNGAFVKLFTTAVVEPKHITGWTSADGWFYITVLGAIADSARVVNTEMVSPISQIQVDNNAESTQIALKISRDIDNFEFYQSKSPPEILLSLRFPLNDVAGIIEQERDEMATIETTETVTIRNVPSHTTDTTDIIEIPSRYKNIRTALYLSGASLTIAGIAIESNKSENISWEIPTGLAIIAGTYIYDKLIYKSDQK